MVRKILGSTPITQFCCTHLLDHENSQGSIRGAGWTANFHHETLAWTTSPAHPHDPVRSNGPGVQSPKIASWPTCKRITENSLKKLRKVSTLRTWCFKNHLYPTRNVTNTPMTLANSDFKHPNVQHKKLPISTLSWSKIRSVWMQVHWKTPQKLAQTKPSKLAFCPKKDLHHLPVPSIFSGSCF